MNKNNRFLFFKKQVAMFLFVFMLLNLGSFVLAGYEQDQSNLPENIIPGELIVKRSDTGPSVVASSFIQGVYSKERLFNMDSGPFGAMSASALSPSESGASSELDNYYIYRMEEEKTQDVYRRLILDPGVEAVSFNYVVSASSYSPNDPLFSSQYNLPKINAGEAITNTNGGASDIVIAVLDTGVRGTHEDLSGRVLAGYDFINNVPIPAGSNSDDDPDGHGTAVASVAAASCNNNKGISGIACNARIMPIKTLDSEVGGSFIATLRGVVYAVNNGAHIINLSLGASMTSLPITILSDFYRYAHESNVVAVAASGNANIDLSKTNPANIPYVITVGASDRSDNRADFSNFGAKIDFVAPGVDIPVVTSATDSSYGSLSGTSFSAPQVSGVVALMLSKNRDLTVEQIRQILRKTAQDIGPAGFDVYTGFGIINAGLAASSSSSVLPSVGMIETLPDDTSGEVSVRGFAKGENFSSYQLSYGVGTSPSSYTQIVSSNSPKTLRGSVLGTWNTSALSNGHYVLRLGVTNNDSSQVFFKIYVNIVSNAPYISVKNPINVNSANTIISGVASAATGADISMISYCLDPSPQCTLTLLNINPARSINFNINLTGLIEKEYYMIVEAHDSMGRMSQQDLIFNVDFTAPSAPVITSPANGSNSSSRVIDFSGTAEIGSSVYLFHNDRELGGVKANYNGSWSGQVELTTGANTLKARAVDAAKNNSPFASTVVNFEAKHFEVLPSKSSLTAGEEIQLTVTAKNPNGTVNTSHVGEVGLTSTDAKATLPSNLSFRPSDYGTKVFSGIILKTAGNQTVSVISSDSQGSTPSITVAPGPASVLKKVSGDKQNSVVGRVLAEPIIVRALDAYENKVPQTSMVATVTEGGGSVTNSSMIAAANAEAMINWRVGPTPGPNTLAVKIGGDCVGECGLVRFSATAVAFSPNVTPANGSGNDIISSSDNKAGIRFPAGSVPEPVFVTVETVTKITPVSPAGRVQVSGLYMITAEKESGEFLGSFASNQPTLEFYFNKNLVNAKNQETARINYLDPDSDAFTLEGLSNHSVDIPNSRVAASTSHLSSFAVLANSTSEAPREGGLTGLLPRTGIDFWDLVLINLVIAILLQALFSFYVKKRTIKMPIKANHLSGFAVLATTTPEAPKIAGVAELVSIPKAGIDFWELVLINVVAAALLQALFIFGIKKKNRLLNKVNKKGV